MNNKSLISAILVVYNEEKKIRECLESLSGVVSEIIVVHDGVCKDRTLEICREYDCEIYSRKHIGEAEPHRPFAIKKTSKDWVLFVDADERLSVGLRNKINSLVKLDFDAFEFKWVAEINGKKSKFLTKQILFRKSNIYYIGLPHIQAETFGIKKNINLELIHDTSEFNSVCDLLKSYFKKNKKWGKISAQMLEDFEKIPLYNCKINDKNLKQVNKIRFIKNYPLVAVFISPLYSFFNAFLLKNRYKQGFLGFALSCHVPLHSFFTCYYLILNKIKIKK